MSPNLGQSLERAHRPAREQSHRLVTIEHLLLALTEDVEAALILQSANVDLGAPGHRRLGIPGAPARGHAVGAGRRAAARRRAAAGAAGGRVGGAAIKRKQIDGAIVLAAIVGDGKSAAAGLLKALGMTFEEAIRALQRANTKARLKPLAKPVAAPAGETPMAAAQSGEPAPAAPDLGSAHPASAPVAGSPATEPGLHRGQAAGGAVGRRDSRSGTRPHQAAGWCRRQDRPGRQARPGGSTCASARAVRTSRSGGQFRSEDRAGRFGADQVALASHRGGHGRDRWAWLRSRPVTHGAGSATCNAGRSQGPRAGRRRADPARTPICRTAFASGFTAEPEALGRAAPAADACAAAAKSAGAPWTRPASAVPGPPACRPTRGRGARLCPSAAGRMGKRYRACRIGRCAAPGRR